MELLAITKIDDIGRILLPKELRQEKGWHKGTKVAICINNDTIVLDTCPAIYDDDVGKQE